MNLYEISANYRALLEAIEIGDIPEDAVADTLEAVEGELDAKIENVACYIKNLAAEADALKTEADKLTERRKAKQAHVDRLRRYLHDALTAAGERKVETPRAVVRIQKTAPSVRIADDAEFIKWAKLERDDLLNYAAPAINKTAIKEAIKDGQTIPGAVLKAGETVVIK